ncbi:MAG: hypothetical protein JWP52_4387 [Rhizobacter sp.]|nr:hypothetical protein [Rhizobacter sp.]
MKTLRSLTPAGVAGVVLLLAAALHQWLLVLPADARLAALRDQALTTSASGHTREAEPQASAAEQLADFQAALPQPDSIPLWLGKINSAAAANGLLLASGEYRIERRPTERLMRYQLTLPVKGSYTQIRGFVGAVLADVPAASVDDIQMRRESAVAPTLDGRVRLSLFLAQP